MADALSTTPANPALLATQRHVESDPLFGWLRQEISVVFDGQRPHQLSLSHLDPNDNPQRMQTYELKSWDDTNAADHSLRVRMAAQFDADHRGRTEKYAVQLWWPMGQSVYHLMVIEGSTISKQNMGSTEPATSDGLLKQFMRHNEAMLRTTVSSIHQVLEVQNDVIERQQTRIHHLEETRYKTLELAEGLMSAGVEREAERARQAASETRKTMAFQSFMELTPILKTKLLEWITGTKMASEHPLVHGMRSLFDGMTMEQMQAMLNQLPPGKIGQLLEIYRGVMNVPKEAQADATTTATSTATITPAPDDKKAEPGAQLAKADDSPDDTKH